MNLYTVSEIQKIYGHCQTFNELQKVITAFHWLIRNGFQERSNDMQRIALAKYKQFL
jgi:hypothetical protein